MEDSPKSAFDLMGLAFRSAGVLFSQMLLLHKIVWDRGKLKHLARIGRGCGREGWSEVGLSRIFPKSLRVVRVIDAVVVKVFVVVLAAVLMAAEAGRGLSSTSVLNMDRGCLRYC